MPPYEDISKTGPLSYQELQRYNNIPFHSKSDRKEWFKTYEKKDYFKGDISDGKFEDANLERRYRNNMFRKKFGSLPNFNELTYLPEEQRDAMYQMFADANAYTRYMNNKKREESGEFVNPYTQSTPNVEYKTDVQAAPLQPISQEAQNTITQSKLDRPDEDDLRTITSQEAVDGYNQEVLKKAKELYPEYNEKKLGENKNAFSIFNAMPTGYTPGIVGSGASNSNDVLLKNLQDQERNAYIRDHVKTSLDNNPYYNLPREQFEAYLKDVNSIYSQFNHTERLPDNQIDYNRLYSTVKPLLDAGLLGKAQNIVQQEMNKIAGQNQGLGEKVWIATRNAAAGFTEETLNTLAIPLGIAEGALAKAAYGLDMIDGSRDWSGEWGERNFWEIMDDLPGLVHKLEEAIAGDEQVYGNTIMDGLFQGGYSIGTMLSIAASAAAIGGATNRAIRPLQESLQAATKAGNMAEVAKLTQQIEHVQKMASIGSTLLSAKSSLNEGMVDGREIYDQIIADAEQKKELIKQDLYQQIAANPDDYAYSEQDAQNIYNSYISKGLREQLLQACYQDIAKNGGITQPDGTVLYMANSNVPEYVNQLLSERAILQAKTNYAFAEHEAEYDANARHEANTARARTELIEAGIVFIPTLFGIGKLAQINPRSVLTKTTNNLINQIPNKYARFGVQAAKDIVSVAGGEVGEEFGQGITSEINKNRADYNINNYAAGLYYGRGSDIVNTLHMGAFEGIGQFAADAWYEMDPEGILRQTIPITLLFGGINNPIKDAKQKSNQIQENNHTALGKIFDYIHEFSPVQTGIGNILSDAKATHIETTNNLVDAYQYLFENKETATILQSEAALFDIKSQMENALEKGDVDTYGVLASAYKAAQATFLAHLATVNNGANRKYAQKFIDRFEGRAAQLTEEEKQQLYEDFMSENSVSKYNDLSRDEVIDIIQKDAREAVDLYQKAVEISKKYDNNLFSLQDIRPLIFGELLQQLGQESIVEQWSQKITGHEQAIQDTINNLRKTGEELTKEDSEYNQLLDYFARILTPDSNVEDRRDTSILKLKQHNQVLNDILSNVGAQHKQDIVDALNQDTRLWAWQTDVQNQFGDMYERLLAKQGALTDRQYSEANQHLNKLKNISDDKYKRKLARDIYDRRNDVSGLVRYIDSLNTSSNERNYDKARNELYTQLEEQDSETYKNLTKALEILNTADNIKAVIRETSVDNPLIQQVYDRLAQVIDLAKENVKEASDLLNIGSYANIIADPTGVLQGFLTDILDKVLEQPEVPEVVSPVEVHEEPAESDPNAHKPKVDSVKTRDRIKQHRKAKQETRKAEEAALAEKEKVEEDYQHFVDNIGDLLRQFDNNDELSAEQLQEGLKDVQQLIGYVNARDFCCYIDRSLLNADLDVLQTLEENILIKLAKALHKEQISSEEEEKIDKEIKKHEERVQSKPKKPRSKSITKQADKIKKIRPSDFARMQNRIASIFSNLTKQNVDYRSIIGYIWRDATIKDIVKDVFGTEENMAIFYETVQDFNMYDISNLEDAKYIVNQVVLANIFNVDPSLLQVPDILDRRTSQRLKEIFGHGNVKKQHKEALEEVKKESSTYYNPLIVAYDQLYKKLEDAYKDHRQLVLQEAPTDCKLTVTIDGKKVPLIISERQAEKEGKNIKGEDSSLIFKDDRSANELPIETGERIDWPTLFNNALKFVANAKTLPQLKRDIEEEAFQYIYKHAQDYIEEQVVGKVITLDEDIPESSYEEENLRLLYESYLASEQSDNREYPIVIELNGQFLPYYTTNNNYKPKDVITIQTEDGIKAATVLYYGLPENNDYNIKATSLDKVVVQQKDIPARQPSKGMNVTVIRPAIREDNESISKEDYKEVQDRIDYNWANDGNVHVGDNIGFVVYTWNSPEGPRRVIYYTTEKQEDGSYHILEVLDQGSYIKQIDPNSSVGKLINRIREADTGVEGFYYQEQGWQVDKVTYNHANPTNNKLSFEEGNLNKVLDEENGVFGIRTDGKVNRVILIKQDRTGFVSTDKNFTQDTLLNSNPNSDRDRSTRTASTREGDAMRENSPLLVVPTTDGFEALNNVRALDPKVEGYMDIIKRSLLTGKVGEIFKGDILQRITDLFRNTRVRNAVEKPTSVSLAKFFKTNNQALVISNDNYNSFSIYITSPDGSGGTISTLLATVGYPADINNASREDDSSKELITSASLEVINGATGERSATTFDDIYKTIVNRITSETNPIINSVNINFEQIQNNPVILDAIIADGLLWSNSVPLNDNGKIKRTGAQVFASNRTEKASESKEAKQIALVNFRPKGPVLSYNIDGLDVQPGDNVESKFGGNQGRVLATMTVAEYEQYRRENNITDEWTAENVLKQPKATFIDRHTPNTTPAPVITAATTEYAPNTSNTESVKGNIPKPVQVVRKKKAGSTKLVQTNPQQTELSMQSDAIGALPSSEVIQENIFRFYENITDDTLLERLDEIGVTENQWNSLDPFARERLITCGKW